MELLKAIAILGIEASYPIDITGNEDHSDLLITFCKLPYGHSVSISIRQDYWRYPGVTSYWVNYSGNNGDFVANPGTPHIERVLFQLGEALYLARK